MQEIPVEAIATSRILALVWIVAAGLILIAGRWLQPARGFGNAMLRQWKVALAIALLHAFGAGIGGYGFFQISSIRSFC